MSPGLDGHLDIEVVARPPNYMYTLELARKVQALALIWLVRCCASGV
jgi:hypothetical protein